ncbi:UvrD-helicase domain-containing protein [Actimicrobium sp. CCI2.3]|uniref:UvrD-helicase domain-containing protein n=1 Tax=Actimicrobium sp. CCI2.3 TaxID=3048616 RepID=UPI002AB50CCE|nr:UvrD-helicase domain-containing protein [Actimicrobium sp. CCI2.3]MDY7574466.1 UvrD-helicase domain-containing protein [Actimicrobium sp. CCI2.3]MEB0022456.1 UvrD-helicase domain-containing protein [Actimicrobium sp. CCI2.3]
MTTTPMELNVFDCPLDGINQIEASAGTGKTWNICGLYLRLLLERRLPVQQILVVTFTKAATAELRQRIRGRIVDTLHYLDHASAESDPFVTSLVSTLQARGIDAATMTSLLGLALQHFDEAAIFTIHGFCQRALADAPFAAGMPLTTELQQSDDVFLLRVAQDFWRRHISSGNLPIDLTNYLLEQRDTPEKFTLLLKRQRAKRLSRTLWPDDIDTPFVSHQTAITQAYREAATCWVAHADDIKGLLEKSDALKSNVYSTKSIAQSCKDWQMYFRIDQCMAAPSLAKSKFALLGSDKLASGTKVGKVMPQHLFFGLAQTLLDLIAQAHLDLTLARLHLLRMLFAEGAEALASLKREARAQSFDDILVNVHSALHSPATPWLAGALLARFPAALIDEFQDTDPLQFAIFDKIYGNGQHPLFFVGDPKQAIYSFRNADLQTYLRARDKATARYTLAENQRSSAGLVAAQNALFSANPAAFQLPGLEYQPVRCGKKPRAVFVDQSSADATAALQLWTLPTDADGMPPTTAMAKRAVEQATAAEIARLLTAAQAGQITLGSNPLQAGDIAVLVKSHAQGSAIRHALAALGIGSVELSQASIFDSIDAEEIERLLHAVLAPNRTGLLLAALSTELLGLDATAIAAIAADETALQGRIDAFNVYRDLWRERGIGVLFRRLLVAEQVSQRMLIRADGERRMTNLLHLGEHLHQASITHPSPDALLRWLADQRRSSSTDDATQLRLESDQDLVQIVTIHRSKGLEYPVVFCPFLWPASLGGGGRNQPEGREYHDAAGLPVIDLRPNPGDLEAIKAAIKQDKSAEFLRLAYVALTRAAQRCYLVVGCYRIKSSTTASSRSMLNWLAAGAGTTPDGWSEHKMNTTDIIGAWSTLAKNNAPQIGIATLPSTPGIPVQFVRPAADALQVQALPPPLRDGWRMTSFSGLQHATAKENAGTDHDLRSNWHSAVLSTIPEDVPDDDLLLFPRGASAGDTLHAVLENIDFANPDSWDHTIRHGLTTHPQRLRGATAD